MASIRHQLIAILAADAAFAALATGGVWDRDLKRNTGTVAAPTPRSTPGAFDPAPPFAVRPSVVVMDGGENPSPGGVRGTFASFPRLVYYAPPTAAGEASIGAMARRARVVLDGRSVPIDGGGSAIVDVLPDRRGIVEEPDMGAVSDWDRLAVEGYWRPAT